MYAIACFTKFIVFLLEQSVCTISYPYRLVIEVLGCFLCGYLHILMHSDYFSSKTCIGKNLIIDPVLEEESHQDGSLMITCMPSRYEVTQLTITGEWSTPKINEVICLHDTFCLSIF